MEGRDAYAEARSDLKRARTILIKIGTEIVHSPDGLLAMGQIGAIVEQVISVLVLHRMDGWPQWLMVLL